ncbi:MAG: TdeIII family type II restriction endonuclease [Patescibacteria group bacterium]
MPLSNSQRLKIKEIIRKAIIKKLNEYQLIGDIKPFHERLFSKERIRATSFFHSCSTTIGVTLFQNIAYLIAKRNKNFKKVKALYDVRGNFSDKVKAVIEDIIFDLGRKQNDPAKRIPNIKKEIQEVLKVADHSGNVSTQRIDLFLTDFKNNEIYIEIKTIKPNKGESEKIKRELLKIVALRNKPVKVLCGIPYNPYEPKEYSWPLILNYLKIGEDLLVGKQFWDFLGGKGTYEELLKVFEETGKELKEKIEKKFQDVVKENYGKN